MDIKGKHALITGGASGIGRALAERLLKGGATVILWDADRVKLDMALKELSPLGVVRCQVVDVCDRRAVLVAADRVYSAVGALDILDLNAAVVYGGGFLEMPEEELLKTIDVNLNAVMWCARAFLPGMIRRGTGHIVMMASAAGLVGAPGMAVYSATKHAVIGLAESLRLELRAGGFHKIGMTIVCPGFVDTGMFAGAKPPRLMPWLKPEALADSIVHAIRKNKLWVREPFLVKLVPALKGLAGSKAMDRVGEILGLTHSMKGWRGR